MILITFYHNSAEVERANKTAFLTEATEIVGVFKEDISIINPTILIESTELPTYNYCYIDELKRFYFIDNITILQNGLYEIDCSVDVLMTYYNILKELTAFIEVQENEFNPYIIDENRGYEEGFDMEEFTLENDLYDLTNPLLEADAHFLLMGLSVDTSSLVEEQV